MDDFNTISTRPDDQNPNFQFDSTLDALILEEQLVDDIKSHSKKNEVFNFGDEAKIVMREFYGHKDYIRSVIYFENHRKIVSAGDDRSVRIWDLDTQICEKIVSEKESEVNSLLKFSDDTVVYCGNDGRLYFFNIATSKHEKVIGPLIETTNNSEPNVVNDGLFTLMMVPGSKSRFFCCSPRVIFLIDNNEPVEPVIFSFSFGKGETFHGLPKIVVSKVYPNCIYLNFNEQYERNEDLERTEGQKVRLWNYTTKEIVRVFWGEKDLYTITCYDFYDSEDGTKHHEVLLGGGGVEILFFYDSATGKCFKKIKLPLKICSSYVFSNRHNSFLFLGDFDDGVIFGLDLKKMNYFEDEMKKSAGENFTAEREECVVIGKEEIVKRDRTPFVDLIRDYNNNRKEKKKKMMKSESGDEKRGVEVFYSQVHEDGIRDIILESFDPSNNELRLLTCSFDKSLGSLCFQGLMEGNILEMIDLKERIQYLLEDYDNDNDDGNCEMIMLKLECFVEGLKLFKIFFLL